MLKVKRTKPKTPKRSKGKKARKAKKTYVKPPSTTVQLYQASHYKSDQIHTQGFFNPFPHKIGISNTTNNYVPHYTTSGGIPYTSTLESYGITNKPPYFLESLIPQTQSNYQQPVPSQTSTTVSGGNPMNNAKTKTFETQTKPESVDYVNLVSPETKGNKETQPDYVALVPMKTKPRQTMKEKLIERSEYRKKNDIPESVKVSPMIRKENMKEKQKEFIKEKKRLRGSGAKKNEEL